MCSTNPALTIAKLKLDCASAALCSSVPFCSHTPLMSFGWLAAALAAPVPGVQLHACSSLVPTGPMGTRSQGGTLRKNNFPRSLIGERGNFSHRETPGFPPTLKPAHGWMKSGSQRPPVLGQAVGSCGQEMLSSTFASERGLRGGVLLSVTGLSCQTPARLAQTHLVSPPEVLCRARDLPRLVRMIR